MRRKDDKRELRLSFFAKKSCIGEEETKHTGKTTDPEKQRNEKRRKGEGKKGGARRKT